MKDSVAKRRSLEKTLATSSGVIDVHAHVLPLAYVEFLRARSIPIVSIPVSESGRAAHPMRPMDDSPEHISERLSLMDDAGVAFQVLSPPPVWPPFSDVTEAAEAASILNDSVARAISKAPDRLCGFVSLPMPHIDAALTELARADHLPGMVGVILSCFYGNCSAADPLFDPLYAEMNRRGTLLFLHPVMNGLCSPLITDWKLTVPAGPTFEDAVIAMHLIINSIPLRFPNIRIIVPHLGGGLSTLLRRLDNQLPLYVPLSEAPSRTAKRFWYDSCCHGSAAALHAAIEAFGAERILPGSDYPYLTPHEFYRESLGFIRKLGLPPEVSDVILSQNAKRLFGDGR